MWVQGHAATTAETWSVIRSLRPRGIVIDDVDSLGSSVNMLLAQIKNARSFARVIVTTANLVGEIRGALLRNGRLADEEARHGRLNGGGFAVFAPVSAPAPPPPFVGR